MWQAAPFMKRGIGTWRATRKWIERLKSTLGAVLDAYLECQNLFAAADQYYGAAAVREFRCLRAGHVSRRAQGRPMSLPDKTFEFFRCIPGCCSSGNSGIADGFAPGYPAGCQRTADP